MSFSLNMRISSCPRLYIILETKVLIQYMHIHIIYIHVEWSNKQQRSDCTFRQHVVEIIF